MPIDDSNQRRLPWLNRTVLGIGMASLFRDWSHEIATTVMRRPVAVKHHSARGRGGDVLRFTGMNSSTSEMAIGSKRGIDATKTIPGKGFKHPWPP